MRINIFNHSNPKEPVFGLIPEYLVYFAGPETSKEHARGRTEAEIRIDEAEKSRVEGEKRMAEKLRDLTHLVKQYNDAYSKRRFEGKPFNEPLVIDNKKPVDTVKQIDRILTTRYKFKEGDTESWFTLANNPPVVHQEQADKLLALRAQFTSSNDLMTPNGDVAHETFISGKWPTDLETDARSKAIKELARDLSTPDRARLVDVKGDLEILLNGHDDDTAYEPIRQIVEELNLKIRLIDLYEDFKSREEQPESLDEISASFEESERLERHAHGSMLVESYDTMREGTERLAVWESKPAYRNMESAFESAFMDSKYKEFGIDARGEYSSTKQRESAQLFFSILSVETNNFDVDFVLGDGFTEDHRENKKRFPYIYEKWLERGGVNKDEEKTRSAKMESIRARLADSMKAGETEKQAVARIANENAGAGISEGDLSKVSDDLPRDEYFLELRKALDHMIPLLEDVNDTDPNKGSYKMTAVKLRIFREYADEGYLYHSMLKGDKESQGEFTKAELSKTGNRQIIMELAMDKYLKAMKMVDNPATEHGNWQRSYNPAVRRLLIADRYRTAVSAYELTGFEGADVNEPIHVFKENIDTEAHWMLGRLIDSGYFNRGEKKEALSADHRDVLLVARIGGMAGINLEHLEHGRKAVDLALKYKEGNRGSENQKVPDSIKAEWEAYQPSDLLSKLLEKTEEQLRTKLNNIDTSEIPKHEEFIKLAKTAIANPYSEAKVELLEKIRNGEYTDILITPEQLAKFQKEITDIDIHFHDMERIERSRMSVLDELGINAEGMWDAYKSAIDPQNGDPSMHLDYWDDMFRDPAKFDDLVALIDQITPTIPNGTSKGRDNFIEVFKTLQGRNPIELDGETNRDQAMAYSVYQYMKMEIAHRQRIEAASARNDAETLAQLNGMTVGDKITDFAKKTLDMLIGPGQSWANRGAGLILTIAAWKLARKALKGDDNMGKGLRILFMAGAAELAVKHVSGRGLLERMGLTTIAETIEGSYKAVLVQQGDEYMKGAQDIEKSEHTAALFELDKVPFNKVMDWYKSSNQNGMPLTEGGPDKFSKLGIDIDKILPEKTSWKQKDKELEARRIVWHTVNNFFGYVGAKNGLDNIDGRKMLEERWVKDIEDPAYTGDFSRFELPRTLLEEYRGNPSKLTWKVVMEAEIDPQDVEETIGKEGIAPITDYLWKQGEEIWRWGRQELYGPLTGHAKEFFQNFDDVYSKQIKDFLGEMGEAGARKLHFAKESASLWYEGNKYEIRHFLGNHWELVKEGVKLPFEVLYAADEFAVPWTLTKLKQAKEIFRDGTQTVSGDLQATHILGMKQKRDANNNLMVDQNGSPVMEPLTAVERMDPKKNPAWKNFGMYTDGFVEAFNASDRFSTYNEKGGPIGYYIDETSFENAGISKDDKGSTADRFYKMQVKAREKARDIFRIKSGGTLSYEDIDDLMYPIHVIRRTGAIGPDPQMIYTFWRMPMKGSAEYLLKKEGHWADYKDPNKHKDRAPFMVDNSLSTLENIKKAFTLDNSGTRTALGAVGKAGALALAISSTTFGAAGEIAKLGARIVIPGAGQDQRDTLKAIDQWTSWEPKTEQEIDEYLTSAELTDYAISDFYEKKENANAYKALYDFAKQKGQPIYLEAMTAFPGYQSEDHKDKLDFRYTDFIPWYESWAKENKVPVSQTFLRKLQTLEREEARMGQ